MQLIIDGVGKKYKGDKWALRDYSLTLNTGVIGLLGPNGAGKSTLMRILATITKPTTGQILWNDIDIVKRPNQVRPLLGYLPQDFGVYPNLNALEFLEYIAAIKGIERGAARKRIEQLLQLVNLTEAAKRPIGGYSGGMKQRVGIAQALLNDPHLLIVDEPTVGLDPEERVRFRNLISDLAGDRIVILSTHIVSDIEAVATDIVVMNQGQLVQHGSPETLLQAVEGNVWLWVVPSAQLNEVKSSHLVSGTIRRSDGMHVRIVSTTRPDPAATSVAPTLEDAYLYFVKN